MLAMAQSEFTKIVRNHGVSPDDSLLVLVPALVWVVVAIALSSRLFRWEARR